MYIYIYIDIEHLLYTTQKSRSPPAAAGAHGEDGRAPARAAGGETADIGLGLVAPRALKPSKNGSDSKNPIEVHKTPACAFPFQEQELKDTMVQERKRCEEVYICRGGDSEKGGGT